MTTVATRLTEIAVVEGFDIIISKDGAEVDRRANGIIGPYKYQRRCKDSFTVSNWKEDRFSRCFPGFTCEVLNGDGTNAIGQTKLETVRATYAEPFDALSELLEK